MQFLVKKQNYEKLQRSQILKVNGDDVNGKGVQLFLIQNVKHHESMNLSRKNQAISLPTLFFTDRHGDLETNISKEIKTSSDNKNGTKMRRIYVQTLGGPPLVLSHPREKGKSNMNLSTIRKRI